MVVVVAMAILVAVSAAVVNSHGCVSSNDRSNGNYSSRSGVVDMVIDHILNCVTCIKSHVYENLSHISNTWLVNGKLQM